MKLSALFGTTLREAPANVDFESHALIIRAGYVRQLSAGIFSYLPLAWRSLRKIEQILREEMEAIGGQEMNMPVIHPAELWQKTGRWQAVDETMVRFTDRGGRDMVLAMTHEEVVAALTHSEIQTYRQLPKLVFQMQTKFRDEPRARGGLVRVREFVMKDSYSLDLDEDGLRQQYVRHYHAYLRIGLRAGLRLLPVRSDVGMMGGQVAHEFMYLTDIGEDTLAICDGCGYAANREVAEFQKEAASDLEPQALEKVHTPAAATIEEVARFLSVDSSQCAKVVCYMAEFAAEEAPKLVVAVVRGDMEVNETKVQNLARARKLRPAQAEEISQAGLVPGFASPIGIDSDKALIIVDDLLTRTPNLVCGANEPDHHYRNANYGRDFTAAIEAGIASVFEGALCIKCGQPLTLRRGVEAGNIFQLGTRYTEALDAHYVTADGESKPVVMGSYGIGVGRLLACAAEEHRDDSGLCLPISVAPYQVHLVALARKQETKDVADEIYQQLLDAGFEVLFDDRDVSSGIKFTDADLLGMPIRVLVSDRSLKGNEAEVKLRRSDDAEKVALGELVRFVQSKIDSLHDEIDEQLRQLERNKASAEEILKG